jgi:hypothetical protein
MFSTAAFYLTTELALTNRRLYAQRPNTLLGLIPVGTNRSNFPIENVAGVNAGSRFDVVGLLFGAIGILIGLAALAFPDGAALGGLLILLSAYAVVGAPKQYIEVMNSGGGVIRFPVSVFERRRTFEFASSVAEAIAHEGRSTSGRRGASEPAEPADAASALRHLQTLRDQGLITADEYAAKRAAVLDRL